VKKLERGRHSSLYLYLEVKNSEKGIFDIFNPDRVFNLLLSSDERFIYILQPETND